MVAAAIGSTDDEPQLTSVAGSIFSHWRDALTRAFVADGFDESDARSLAIMCIASLEGAVVLCRSTHSVDPLADVAYQLEFLIKSREFVRALRTARRSLRHSRRERGRRVVVVPTPPSPLPSIGNYCRPSIASSRPGSSARRRSLR